MIENQAKSQAVIGRLKYKQIHRQKNCLIEVQV
jgi:hypothetical protein